MIAIIAILAAMLLRSACDPAVIVHRFAFGLLAAISLAGFAGAAFAGTNTYALTQAAPPATNPLKGFMPYAGSYDTFPYSMEWSYLPLRALMTGATNFDWSSLETFLNTVAGRGHQAVFRVYLDYPGQATGIPQYLLDAGLATYTYSDYNNNGLSLCPDYSNGLLQQALTNFISALGTRYDGDARIGFITVGLLGFWGEWHTYPHTNWFASVAVQNQVLNAYEAAFQKTRLLVRWPSGTNPTARQIGYHDDSFAYETIDPPSWMFLGLLKTAGETNKWRTQPIGGEVRPEVQSCMWDPNQTNCVPPGQEFSNCVALTHASWMLNQGAFVPGLTAAQKSLALAGSALLGYQIYVPSVVFLDATVSEPLNVAVQVRNLGTAPFYYDWPVELGAVNASNLLVKTWPTNWKLSSLLPDVTNTVWNWVQTNHGLAAGQYKIVLGVPNLLTNGASLVFANAAQGADLLGWLTLGQVSITPAPPKPSLKCGYSPAGFEILVNDAAPGAWTVEATSDLILWTPWLTTNTSTPDWSVTDGVFSSWRFYRVVGSQ